MPPGSASATATQMFPLGSEARQAAARCSGGGAEEVLSFVANSRSEDSLTHVILILLHKECGARLVARFSQSCVRSPHRAGRRGTRLAVIPSRWPRIPKYPPRFLMSPMRLFPFSEGPLSGGGGSFGVFWKCWDPGPCHRCCHRSLRLLQPAPRTTTRLRWLLVSPPPRIFRKQIFSGASSSSACLSLPLPPPWPSRLARSAPVPALLGPEHAVLTPAWASGCMGGGGFASLFPFILRCFHGPDMFHSFRSPPKG